jgi:DNA helicase HerA-like ATPase
MNLNSTKFKSSTPNKTSKRGYQMDLSNVRIREHFGLLSNNTHTDQFTFLVSPPKNRSGLEKHDYVLINHPLFGEACQVLAAITDIASYEEVAGGSSAGEKIGKMLATCEILGYLDLTNETVKPLRELLVPPNPGSRVYIPLKTFLEDVLNRNAEGEVFKTPIEVGQFEATSAEEQGNNGRIKCFMDAQNFVSKHTLITSVTGAGKTTTAKQLIQQMVGKTQVQTVVFDAYGEYAKTLASANEVNLKTDKDTLAKEIKKGQTTILNASGSTLEEKRGLYTQALQTLLKLKLEEKAKPLLLIVEEAENLKGEVLDQVVAQGRKIGVTLCLLTTHPSELGGKCLAQMGNQIIGKTTNKEDIDFLANVAGPANALPSLEVGEWISNGITAYRPMKIHVKYEK